MGELWNVPGWGMAFAMWTIAAAVGAAAVLLATLTALRARKRSRR